MFAYIILGIIVASYALWLILWKDAMESRPKKRKPIKLDEIKLGGLMGFIAAFLGMVACWPFMALMAVGMTWEVYDLSDIVVWTRDKDISLKGIDDVTPRDPWNTTSED